MIIYNIKGCCSFSWGLNDNYSQARSQILLMPQLPSVNQACALVNQDESQKLVVGSSGLVHENMAPTAMFTSRSRYQKPKEPYAPNAFCDYCHIECHLRADCNKLLKCDHCHKTGHLKVVCFRLIGYPPDYKGKREVVVAGNFVYDTRCVTGSLKSPLNPPNYYPMLQTCVPSVQASFPQQGMMPMPMFTQGQHQQLLRMLEQTSIDETTSSAISFAYFEMDNRHRCFPSYDR